MDLSSWTSPACYIYKGLREHTTLSFSTFVEEEAQSGEVMWLSNFGITPRVSFILASTSGYKPLPPTSQLVRGRSCVSRGFLCLDSISLPAGLIDLEGRGQSLTSGHCLWGLIYPPAPAGCPELHPKSAAGPKSQNGIKVLALC